MVMFHINELYVGCKVIQNDEPYIIIENECIKPGKGRSFNRVRLKQIISGKILEKTFKSGDLLESADIMELNLVYIYHDRDLWYFMNEKSYEQISISSRVIGNDIIKWMKDQLYYLITFWNEIPILVTPPVLMELQVIRITAVPNQEDNSSSDVMFSFVSSRANWAVLSTGAFVKVPCFIKSGEFIKVNTRTGMYVSRAKNK